MSTVIQFATCNRGTALKFLREVYPSRTIDPEDETIKTILDYVERDIIRIQDPMMYGKNPQVVPGKKWVENAEMRKTLVDLLASFREEKDGES